MGFGELYDELNPPTPSQDDGQGALPTREIGAVDPGQISPADHNSSAANFMPFQYVLPAITSPQYMHGYHQSYPRDMRTDNNVMAGVLRRHHLQSPQIYPSFSDLGGSLRKVDSYSSGLQNTQVNETFVPKQSDTAGVFQKDGQTREAENTNVTWSHVSQRSLNLGYGASLSNMSTNVVQTDNNNLRVSTFDPGKVYGSFLTLGIGSNPEARAKKKFDPREIASNLEEAVVPKSSSPDTSPYPNLTNDFSTFSSNPMGFVDPMSNLGDWISLHNDDVAKQGGTIGIISDPYTRSHVADAFKQRYLFENTYNNSGFVDSSIGSHSALESFPHTNGSPCPSSFPLDRTYSYRPQPGYTRASDWAPEASKPTWFTTQSTRDLLGSSHSINTGDVSSSFGTPPTRIRGNTVTKDFLGISMERSEGNAIQPAANGPQLTSISLDGQLSSVDRVHSAHAFGSTIFPEKPATSATFPRRLGVDDAAGAAATATSSNQSLLPTEMGVPPRSKILPHMRVHFRGNAYESRNFRAPQPAKYLLPVSGHNRVCMPVHSNLQIPSFSTGLPQQTLPAHLPRVIHTPGTVLSNTKICGPSRVYNQSDQPSLKRRANEPPLVVSWGQKKRMVTVPPNTRVGVPAAPAASAYIKWEGFASPPILGYKCFICKRDLSFDTKGPASQPSILPAGAVLPCGHTFHDHCLESITPKDQGHDPPCIPCAIGEKEE